MLQQGSSPRPPPYSDFRIFFLARTANRADPDNREHFYIKSFSLASLSVSLWSSLHLQSAVGGIYECGTVDLPQDQQGAHLMSLRCKTQSGNLKKTRQHASAKAGL